MKKTTDLINPEKGLGLDNAIIHSIASCGNTIKAVCNMSVYFKTEQFYFSVEEHRMYLST